jgi:2-isopropylmalate synthase
MSGQTNVLVKAEAMGLPLGKGSPEVQKILTEVKRLESEGYEFEAAEASFELLIRRQLGHDTKCFDFVEFHTTHRCHAGREDSETNEATVKLRVDGVTEYTVDQGDGPINALDKALRKALLPHFPHIAKVRLEDYKVRIIDSGSGTAAKTRVLIVSSDGAQTWGTVGVSTNVIDASWQALVDSFEYFLMKQR